MIERFVCANSIRIYLLRIWRYLRSFFGKLLIVDIVSFVGYLVLFIDYYHLQFTSVQSMYNLLEKLDQVPRLLH